LRKTPLLAFLVLLLAVCWPIEALAASAAKLTAAAKTSLDKTAAEAPAQLRAKLTARYSELEALYVREQQLEQDTKALHKANAEAEAALRERMKQLDAAKLDKLLKQTTEAKERYKPLFTLQTSLNKQLAAARKLKNKTLTEALATQAEVVKLSAQLARQEIRWKEEAYAKAKADKDKVVKEVRAVLATGDTVLSQLRTEKSASVQTGKLIAAENKNTSAILKKRNAEESFTALSSLTVLSGKLVSQKATIYGLEQKYGSILSKADKLLP
jgi:hypothetical protein